MGAVACRACAGSPPGLDSRQIGGSGRDSGMVSLDPKEPEPGDHVVANVSSPAQLEEAVDYTQLMTPMDYLVQDDVVTVAATH